MNDVEKADFQKFVSELPKGEEKVPLLVVGNLYYTPEQILTNWDNPQFGVVKERVEVLLKSLRSPTLNLSEDLLKLRILTKYNLGMLKTFIMIPDRKVTPEELLEHLAKKDEIGIMRLRAERKVLAELSRPIGGR